MLSVSLPVLLLSASPGAEAPVVPYGTVYLTATRDAGLQPEGVRTPGQEKGTLRDLSERDTLVGLRMNPAPLAGLAVAGRVEIDFHGGSADNPQPRLRHACFTVADAQGRWELLAGRSDEVIAPLRADSINFPAESWPGDIGSRRTQFRATWKGAKGPGPRLVLQAALNPVRQTLRTPAGAPAEQAQVMAAEGRAAVEFDFAGRPAAVGVWGHHGQEHHPAHDTSPGGELRTRSLGLDAQVALGRTWSLTLEVWSGEVGDAYPSADFATVALASDVRSAGGWAAVGFKPDPAWRFNLGFGLHDPENRTLLPGQRSRMESWFINGFRTFGGRLELGMEASRWRSTFAGTTASNDDLRLQLSLGWSF